MTGIIIQYLLFCVSFSRPEIRPLLPSLFGEPISEPFIDTCGTNQTVEADYLRPGLGNAVFTEEDAWTHGRIREMIHSTKGFLARDWPLDLGWNNLQYILEAGMMEAKLSNRTLILPSFVYACQCIAEQLTCAAFAAHSKRSEESVAEHEQQTWRIPVGLFVDIPQLREIVSVITVGEYLRYHHLPPSLEKLDGHWDTDNYRMLPGFAGEPARNLSMATSWEGDYAENIVRVDSLPRGPKPLPNVVDRPIYKAIEEKLNGHKTVFLDEAKQVIRDQNLGTWKNDKELNDLLMRNGWAVVYTFEGVWKEMAKTVTKNSDQVAIISRMRGFLDEYGDLDADILFLQGEIHNDGKPGSVWFSTANERTKFATMILIGVRSIPPIRLLAELLSRKMQKLTGGRQFMSAYLQRNVSTTFGWSPHSSIEGPLAYAKQRLEDGREFLDELWRSHAPSRTVDVPGIVPDTFYDGAPPPHMDDKIFVGTDERNETALAYLRNNGVVLMSDLLGPTELRLVGWPMLFGEIQAQVEQIVASHGGFFWGYRMSSIAYLRAARGMDPRTARTD